MTKKSTGSNRVNIRDIANVAGLSISTVSRVLNGKADQYRIGKKSQDRVKKIANEMNYVPNQFAANLKSGKSKTIALMVPSLNNPFFAEIASRVNSEIRKYGYVTIIVDSNEDQEIEKKELSQLLSRNIEGLIIVPCGNQKDHINILHEKGIPIVCLDRYFKELKIPYVSTDNYKGAYLATKYLLDLGHRHIACIQGIKESNTNKLRVSGFKYALQEADIKNSILIGDDFTTKNGYVQTKVLLKHEKRPTAVLALSNTIAMGCMKALKETNICVPRDISLITFDDHPYLEFLATPLTCVEQPVKRISKLAVKFIFSILTGKKIKQDQILLMPTMKTRLSVRKLN